MILNASIHDTDTKSCALLCSLQNVKGCCYLTTSNGCLWKHGAEAHSGGSGLAVDCNGLKNVQTSEYLLFKVEVSYHK